MRRYHLVCSALNSDYTYCHICVMVFRNEIDKKWGDVIKRELNKPDDGTIPRIVINNIKEIPQEAITTGISIYGTHGPVCLTHSASHDEDDWLKKTKQADEQARISRWKN